jgi:4-hydroxybenzoate polyprenyltransferase
MAKKVVMNTTKITANMAMIFVLLFWLFIPLENYLSFRFVSDFITGNSPLGWETFFQLPSGIQRFDYTIFWERQQKKNVDKLLNCMLVLLERNSIFIFQSQNLKSQQNPKPKVQDFVIGIWKLKTVFSKFLQKIEQYPLTLTVWLVSFSAIIAVRMLGENLLQDFSDKSAAFFVDSILAAWLFFAFSFLIVLIFLTFWLKIGIKKVANVLLWGFWLAVFPPIIDKLWCGQNFCWSFYAFDSIFGLFKRFFTFFGNNAAIGITYGVRVEVALAVVFVGIYAYINQKSVIRAILAGVFSYCILFILGSFPSWLTYFYFLPEKSLFSVQGTDIAGIFLSPAVFFSISETDFVNALNVKMNLIYAFFLALTLIFFFWLFFRVHPVKSDDKVGGAAEPQFNRAGKFWPVVKNIRWVQIMIHIGLIFTGAGLGAFYFQHNFQVGFFQFFAISNLALAAVFAWIASVFLNDEIDLDIDKMTNKGRPLATGVLAIDDYRQLFWIFFAMSLVLAITVGVKFFLIILIYQAIGWIYSAWPFRLKRFPGVASLLSALSLTLLFSGGFMLLADGQSITRLPREVLWLLAVAFAVSLPIKDLKDIEGDKADGVFTVPVLLGETWARFAIGLGIFLSYALSVVWLNAKILFLPAMMLGAASFWILQNKKIAPRRVHVWVLGLLFLYVALIFWLMFWPAVSMQ